jgi:predicted DsbA family dithiol-disulfide isomerase
MTRLEIVSDPVCPWCYLSAANLMRAVAQSDAHPFAFAWRPYQLDPDTPPEGRDRAAHMAAKFPDPERLAQAHARLTRMGAESGIGFRFDRITRAPNTLDAHRVVAWAEPEGLQTRTAMALSAATSRRARTSPTPPCSAPPPKRPASTARRSPRSSPATPTASASRPKPTPPRRWA